VLNGFVRVTSLTGDAPWTATATYLATTKTQESRLQVLRPGEGSFLAAPFEIGFRLKDEAAQFMRVELFGEGGELISRYVMSCTDIPQNVDQSMKIDFEVQAPEEQGLLVLSLANQYGQLIELHSFSQTLLAKGASWINPYSDLSPRIIIERPNQGAVIRGGKLQLGGRVRAVASRQLKAKIISQEGKVLGQKLIRLSNPDQNGISRYLGEISFRMDKPTDALLVVYQDSYQRPQMRLLTSVPVKLIP